MQFEKNIRNTSIIQSNKYQFRHWTQRSGELEMHIKKIKLDNLKHPMRLSSTPNHPYMICYVISTGLVE